MATSALQGRIYRRSSDLDSPKIGIRSIGQVSRRGCRRIDRRRAVNRPSSECRGSGPGQGWCRGQPEERRHCRGRGVTHLGPAHLRGGRRHQSGQSHARGDPRGPRVRRQLFGKKPVVVGHTNIPTAVFSAGSRHRGADGTAGARRLRPCRCLQG